VSPLPPNIRALPVRVIRALRVQVIRVLRAQVIRALRAQVIRALRTPATLVLLVTLAPVDAALETVDLVIPSQLWPLPVS